ncbi:MAG: hypothetical protein LC662_13205 [Rhodothermaceae bacterium]|nr:hypothetical protein [Rhodothermaceae bacterium]
MHLMGWDHPRGTSLVERLENARLYPLTLLHSLSKKEKKLLIDNNLILAEEILVNTHLLVSIGLDEPKIRKVIKECRDLHEGVEPGNRGIVEQANS